MERLKKSEKHLQQRIIDLEISGKELQNMQNHLILGQMFPNMDNIAIQYVFGVGHKESYTYRYTVYNRNNILRVITVSTIKYMDTFLNGYYDNTEAYITRWKDLKEIIQWEERDQLNAKQLKDQYRNEIAHPRSSSPSDVQDAFYSLMRSHSFLHKDHVPMFEHFISMYNSMCVECGWFDC